MLKVLILLMYSPLLFFSEGKIDHFKARATIDISHVCWGIPDPPPRAECCTAYTSERFTRACARLTKLSYIHRSHYPSIFIHLHFHVIFID